MQAPSTQHRKVGLKPPIHTIPKIDHTDSNELGVNIKELFDFVNTTTLTNNHIQYIKLSLT